MLQQREELLQLGYSLGRSVRPNAGEVWIRGDRSTRVIGPMGSGKTLMLMAPILRWAPGACLGTSTKADLYHLTYGAREKVGPLAALDPLGMVPSAPRLRWSPISGAQNSRVAEKRGRAFASGVRQGRGGSEGAEFYRHQAGTFLMCLFHAAALDGADLRTALRWARRPQDTAARRILENNPAAAPGWGDMLDTIVQGDDRTVGNTMVTVGKALSPFDHDDLLREIGVKAGQETDLRQHVRDLGTCYVLGKDDAFSAVAPLLTAVVEDVLDAAEDVGSESATSPRMDPWFVAALDELANITPIPSLRQRVTDGRGRGIAIVYAVQAWASIVARYGQDAAKELESSTSNAVVFGGDKDIAFLSDLERLCGQREVTKTSIASNRDTEQSGSSTASLAWEPVMRAQEIRELPRSSASARVLVLAENLPPIISELPSLLEHPQWPSIVEDTRRARSADQQMRQAAETARLRSSAQLEAGSEDVDGAAGGAPVAAGATATGADGSL